MGFKELLKDNLKSKIKDLDLLPSSYQIIGDVCLFKLKDELLEYKQDIGKATLELIPRIKTVCLIRKVEGEFREPEVEVIAGNGTETVHKENKCVFELDVAEIMWSKGNQEEKRRLIEEVKDKDVVIDMFAGIGYWSIPLAKNKDVKVYAIEYNPKAYSYLKKNIDLNKVGNKVIPIEGDCRKEVLKLKGDRIIMGYFPNTIMYLKAAKEAVKDGCWIHYHDICDVGDENKLLDKIKEVLSEFIVESKFRVVKKYSPGVNHIVFDLKIKRKL
jgi:tRNA wybutosine-synthesizing protein 2